MLRMSSAIGMRLPAHVTGVGKALLAALPEDELARRFSGVTLERMTPNSITTFEALMADLEATRLRGYALDNEESSPQVGCVAAALLGPHGEVVAGMSISGPISRMNKAREGELAHLVTAAVSELGSRLGYPIERRLAAGVR